MPRFHLFALCFLVAAGCNRQDVDGLSRIGRKVADRTQTAASPWREQWGQTLKGIGSGAGIKERVQVRLQWDKALADTTIEIAVVEHEVELKGKLKTDDQRRRAVELAETTAGVERVVDRLQIE